MLWIEPEPERALLNFWIFGIQDFHHAGKLAGAVSGKWAEIRESG
jgi:hypothetical protein